MTMTDLHAPFDLSIRLTQDERRVLEAAAERSSTDLGDFMRRRSLEAAEVQTFDSRVVTIPEQDWVKFEAWINTPGKTIPKLQDLARRSRSWER